MSALVLLHTTVADAADAERLADRLIESRLAACVHVETISSTYRWQGRIERAREWRLSAKTSAARLDEAADLLRREHPYELPAIWTTPVVWAEPAYADWVAAESQAQA
ncbi:divalent-cation tolerance protein CutA [Arenimonas fontis]|uniref:divalent-cation tolerance protein CutA n=1 Tax=Arenimonas fontis TaxID=2608255 RepID=UPI001AEDFF0E|nr:divalent-cation tolerance protein CutA [Arenimonas fontis]